MALKTTLEQLESVQAAIEKIELRGTAWSASGQSLTRADLDSLYAREEFLINKLARESRGGGMRVRGATPTG